MKILVLAFFCLYLLQRLPDCKGSKGSCDCCKTNPSIKALITKIDKMDKKIDQVKAIAKKISEKFNILIWETKTETSSTMESEGSCDCCDNISLLEALKTKVDKMENKLEHIATTIKKISEKIPKKQHKKDCPKDFEYFPEINECLYLNRVPLEWAYAQRACVKFKKGGRFLTIKDSVKQEIVARYLQQQFSKSGGCVYSDWPDAGNVAWIGIQTARADECKSTYVWKSDGKRDEPIIYANWIYGAANCATGNCALIGTSPGFNYRWKNFFCLSKICSVCEF